MVRTGAPQRFSIRRYWKPPWWLLFAWLAWLWASVLLAAIIRDYEPPAGWPGAIAATPLIAALFGFVFWVGRIHSDQHIVVRADGLLFAIPFRRLIPFEKIEHINQVRFSEPLGEFCLSTFVNRKLVPARDEVPNVEIYFREPIRLNLYPFKWFRLLQLTIDMPSKFLDALPNDVTVYRPEGGEDWPERTEADGRWDKVILIGVLIVLAVATIYWIAFDG